MALLASGLLLHVAYDPLLFKAWRQATELLLPSIGVSAAMLLTWTGSVATGLQHGLLAQAPLPVPVMAMLTTCSFALGNGIKLRRMAPQWQKSFVGQAFKVLASSLLFTGNALTLNCHELRSRRPSKSFGLDSKAIFGGFEMFSGWI